MQTLLIVDEFGFTRQSLANSLLKQGYSVLQASDATDGALKYRQNAPDLILTSLHEPSLTGRRLIAEVRESGGTVPILVVAGNVEDAILDECDALGVSEFLNYPIESDALVAAVSEALAATAAATV